MILCGNPEGAFAAIGIECSSFVLINSGTSGRCPFNGWGDVLKPVQCANMGTSRCQLSSCILSFGEAGTLSLVTPNAAGRSILLLALLSCLGHVWYVENPGSTRIHHYPRMQWLFKVLSSAEVPATSRFIPYPKP